MGTCYHVSNHLTENEEFDIDQRIILKIIRSCVNLLIYVHRTTKRDINQYGERKMTRYFMIIETGSVYTEEEIREWDESDEENELDWDEICEVRPKVENPDDSNPDDWEEI